MDYPTTHFAGLLGTTWASILLNLLLILLIVGTATALTLQVLEALRERLGKKTYLEISLPAYEDKPIDSTEQLFKVFGSLNKSSSLRDKLLRKRSVFSLEIVSDFTSGIRFMAVVPKARQAALITALSSFMPSAKIKPTSDYLSGSANASVTNFKLEASESDKTDLKVDDSHDHIAYLLGAMNKVNEGEVMAIQLVFAPKNLKAAKDQPKQPVSKLILPVWLVATAIRLVKKLYSLVLQFINFALNQELGGSRQEAFEASLRALVVTDSQADLDEKRTALASALSLNGLKHLNLLPVRYSSFKNRSLSIISSSNLKLSSQQMAMIYHFPNNQATSHEGLNKHLSLDLPIPVGLKEEFYAVRLGNNSYHGSQSSIGLTDEERQRHLYIVGGTGSGKTTMIEYAALQDIKANKAVTVIDPHGDLAESLIKRIPKSRQKDLIYFNPSDTKRPLKINLLELPKGLNEERLNVEKDFVTEQLVSVLRKVFSEDSSGGNRLEYILRNSIATAFTIKDATLFTIYRLLTDPAYRNSVINDLDNKDLKNFWFHEFNSAGSMQRIKMSIGLTSKLGRFLQSASVMRVFDNPTSTLNFDEVINSRKILVCNFSKGKLGEDTSALFGSITMAMLQLSLYRRARLNKTTRKPFYLYIDEFQNFATESFMQLLSEGRKYNVSLTMAEQSPSQIDSKKINVILSNVGSIVCFRLSSPNDVALMHPLFAPKVLASNIMNLPTHNFYLKISAIEPRYPTSGQTVLAA